MPAPIVTWRTQDDSALFENWAIGTVDAGSTSNNVSFLIWNNRGGGTDVSDMQNCTITTKDNSGGNTGEVITNRWVWVKVDSLGESSFTAIGGDTTKIIRAGASTLNFDGTWTPNVAPHAGSGTSYDILGVKCDPNKATAGGNYAEVTAQARVPLNAGAGTTNFRLRVAYQYI